jgi:hypothetical protein
MMCAIACLLLYSWLSAGVAATCSACFISTGCQVAADPRAVRQQWRGTPSLAEVYRCHSRAVVCTVRDTASRRLLLLLLLHGCMHGFADMLA